MQPDPSQYKFDLESTLNSIVALRTQIPEDALTAGVLGTERAGHGVVIDEQGLILTIGYLVTEAQSVWVVDHRGHGLPGHVVGYDQESGFGLVQALGRLDVPPLPRGRCASLLTGSRVVVAGHGGLEHAVEARVTAKREFAGYWEYVLDSAVFTSPAHPNWGGAALIGAEGELLGIGSLLVQQVGADGQGTGANMIVPIDLLEPILDDLRLYGRRQSPPRPWMGWLVHDDEDRLIVAGVYSGCPADRGGIKLGDVVLEVDGVPVQSLADLFRLIWRQGPAGVRIPITVLRDGDAVTARVETVDRQALLKSAPLH
ncbi:MAG: serine protease [Ectothiorhodospiraceae bacterium]|nr:serine protease [Chromatiales bacterium]MCP5156732.1 serine protease [Ectothiorhodospiraceae bacterium]